MRDNQDNPIHLGNVIATLAVDALAKAAVAEDVVVDARPALKRSAKPSAKPAEPNGAMMSKEEFRALSPAEQRVVIAQDVLLQLDMGMSIAHSGSGYFVVDFDYSASKTSAKALVARNCYVCVIGAVFVAKGRRVGGRGFNPKAIANIDESSPYLHDTFDVEMLMEMEALFEGWDNHELSLLKVPAEKRMRLIMQNIIDNNGELKLGPGRR